jgi:hypothetical protein
MTITRTEILLALIAAALWVFVLWGSNLIS